MNFDSEKAVQCLNFFASKSQGRQISKLKAFKLVFLADRYHIRKYGRLITNDEYWAMRLGPVPSAIKDFAEFSDSLDKDEKGYESQFLSRSPFKPHYLQSLGAVDKDVFSASDLEALNFAWDKFSHIPDIVEFVHRFPEWRRHKAALECGSTKRARMNVLDFLSPNSGLEAEFVPLSEEDAEAIKADLKEQERLEELLDTGAVCCSAPAT